MRRVAGIAVAAATLGCVLAAALTWFGLPRHAAATATVPVWTEVAWPFPIDQWGKGKAFRCKAAETLGDKIAARQNYQQLTALTANADMERPEVAAAKRYLAGN